MQRSEIVTVLARLDATVGTLLTRDCSLGVEEFQSCRELPGTLPASALRATTPPEGSAPAWGTSRLLLGGNLLPNPSLDKLCFQYDESRDALGASRSAPPSVSELITLPAAPTGEERALALAQGHTTEDALRAAEDLRAELIARIGLGELAHEKTERRSRRCSSPP